MRDRLGGSLERGNVKGQVDGQVLKGEIRRGGLREKF